jgi:hypothetical protein
MCGALDGAREIRQDVDREAAKVFPVTCHHVLAGYEGGVGAVFRDGIKKVSNQVVVTKEGNLSAWGIKIMVCSQVQRLVDVLLEIPIAGLAIVPHTTEGFNGFFNLFLGVQ